MIRTTIGNAENTASLTRREALLSAGIAMAVGVASAIIPTAFAGEPPEGGMGGEPPEGGMGGTGQAGGAPGEPPEGGMGGADTMTFDYAGTYTGALEADGTDVVSDGEAFDASEADQNAALAQNGGALTVSNGTFTKSGDDNNGDNCNFYGVNSIALSVGEGSVICADNCVFSATSEGSNGLFATDSGVIFANGVSIATTAGNSRGLDATYAGAIIAADVDIQTKGEHCAAVATDRGGGSISVAGGTFSTEGSGSPLLYSTGDIQVKGVTGVASGSQIAGMEGLNTILIRDSTLESTITGATASDPVADGVIIYQSTSGDAEASTGDMATFQAIGSTLKSAIASGAMFYVTNTSVNVVLKDTTLDFDSDAADLIYCAGNDANNWGTPGSNGATANFTFYGERISGDVVADTTSALSVFLLEGTNWSGGATIEQNSNGSTSTAPLTINVDASSTWSIWADATVSAINIAEGGKVIDTAGNPVSIVAGGQTVVQGASAFTVYADSYSTSVVVGDANAIATDLIDRSAFDGVYGTSTAWDMDE